MKFVFDIDDTILFSKIDEKGNYHLKNHDQEMVDKINRLYDEGHTIIIETGRHWNHLNITIKQLDLIKLKRHTIICGKPSVGVDGFYVDDRALRPNEFLAWSIK